MNNLTEKDALSLIKGKLSRYFGVSPAEASKEQIYKSVVMCVRDMLLEKRHAFNKKYRISMQDWFLGTVGRTYDGFRAVCRKLCVHEIPG